MPHTLLESCMIELGSAFPVYCTLSILLIRYLLIIGFARATCAATYLHE